MRMLLETVSSLLLMSIASAEPELSLAVVLSPGLSPEAADEAKLHFQRLRDLGVRPSFIDFSGDDRPHNGSSERRNTLYVTRGEVCGSVVNGSVGVAVVSEDEGERGFLSALAYALSFYHLPPFSSIPLYISTRMRDCEVLLLHEREARFADRSVYSSVVRVKPGWGAEAELWLALAKRLRFKELLFLHTVNQDGDAALSRLEEVLDAQNGSAASRIHIQHLFPLQPRLNDSKKELREAEEETSNVFVLHAGKAEAEVVFRDAAALGLTGAGMVWLVSEKAMSAPNVPQGALSARLTVTRPQLWDDAIALFTAALRSLAKTFPVEEILPPDSGCTSINTGTPIGNRWVRTIGPAFYDSVMGVEKTVEGRRLSFDRDGDREGAEFEILNLQGAEWRVVGHFRQGHLAFNDRRETVWPGGSRDVPAGFSLDTHLKVLTVADRPFVYKSPVAVEGSFDCASFPWDIRVSAEVTRNVSEPCVDDATGLRYCCTGLCVALLHSMNHHLNPPVGPNFTYDLHLMTSYGDRVSGALEANWTGVVGELARESADVVVAALTITPERESVIDFTKPWLYHGIKIMERKAARMSPMESFMQPFKWSLWATLFGSVFVVGVVLYFLDAASPFAMFYRRPDEKALSDPLLDLGSMDEDEALSLSGSMWFVWGVLLDSGIGEKTPRSFSSRVLGVVWCGFSMIMVASYTANLAAFLVLDQLVKQLTGISDARLRNPSVNFSFATVANSSTYRYFKHHLEHATMSRQMEGRNYEDPDRAVTDVKQGRLHAFIWDSVRLEFEVGLKAPPRARDDEPADGGAQLRGPRQSRHRLQAGPPPRLHLGLCSAGV